MIQLHLETAQEENQNPSETENRTQADMLEHKPSLSNDRFPAPSTPQLEQGKRLLGDGDCQDQTSWLVDKETREQDDGLIELRIPSCSKSKYVENTLEKIDSGVACLMPNSPSKLGEVAIEEVNSLVKDGSISSYSQNGDNLDPSSKGGKQTKGTVPTPSSCKSRISRKKMKVDWTPKLHKQFVEAVELLGINQAIPSKILELMKVEGLTRHNVASHLQKYRMHRRPIMPKEDELTSWRIWQQQRYPMQMSTYPHKAVMASSPYPTNQLYPVWGHPSNIQIWGNQGYPTLQPFHHGMHADAWGFPVAQVQNPYPFYPQNLSPCHGLDVGEDYGNEAWRNSLDLFTDEEEAMIDAVLREAINNPWLPLPLGLKSPSIESVLTDLERQGITAVLLRTTTPQI